MNSPIFWAIGYVAAMLGCLITLGRNNLSFKEWTLMLKTQPKKWAWLLAEILLWNWIITFIFWLIAALVTGNTNLLDI